MWRVNPDADLSIGHYEYLLEKPQGCADSALRYRVSSATRVNACEGELIYAEEVWPEVGRRGNSPEPVEVLDFHLRFQRTLPSRLSSKIIP
jgi:hypothetical protein